MVYLVGENPIGVLSDELSWTLSPELYILSYFLGLQAFCIWFGINVIILKGWLIDEQITKIYSQVIQAVLKGRAMNWMDKNESKLDNKWARRVFPLFIDIYIIWRKNETINGLSEPSREFPQIPCLIPAGAAQTLTWWIEICANRLKSSNGKVLLIFFGLFIFSYRSYLGFDLLCLSNRSGSCGCEAYDAIFMSIFRVFRFSCLLLYLKS